MYKFIILIIILYLFFLVYALSVYLIEQKENEYQYFIANRRVR